MICQYNWIYFNLCSGLRPSERHKALKVETPLGSPTRIEVNWNDMLLNNYNIETLCYFINNANIYCIAFIIL